MASVIAEVGPDAIGAAGQGALRVFVDQTFALTKTADAHRAISAGHAQGKIVLIP